MVCAPAVPSSSVVGTAKKSGSPAPPNGESSSPTNSALKPSAIPTFTKPPHAQAVASLAPMLVETSRSLNDPSGKTLYDAWKETLAREKTEGNQSGQFSSSGIIDESLADPRIGSGSDHTVFLNFIGMPVLGLGFDGDYGVYHSAYDDFYWMNHFGDPGYKYHTLMSQLWGVTALRLANADLLPFDFASYASNVRQFVNELAKANEKTMSEQ